MGKHNFLKYFEDFEAGADEYEDDIQEEVVYESEEYEDESEVDSDGGYDNGEVLTEIYIKRLVNELYNFGLNKKLINNIVGKVFYGEESSPIQESVPARRASTRQKPTKSMHEYAEAVMDGDLSHIHENRVARRPQQTQPKRITRASMSEEANGYMSGMVEPQQPRPMPQYQQPMNNVNHQNQFNDIMDHQSNNFQSDVPDVNMAAPPQSMLRIPEGVTLPEEIKGNPQVDAAIIGGEGLPQLM